MTKKAIAGVGRSPHPPHDGTPRAPPAADVDPAFPAAHGTPPDGLDGPVQQATAVDEGRAVSPPTPVIGPAGHPAASSAGFPAAADTQGPTAHVAGHREGEHALAPHSAPAFGFGQPLDAAATHVATGTRRIARVGTKPAPAALEPAVTLKAVPALPEQAERPAKRRADELPASEKPDERAKKAKTAPAPNPVLAPGRCPKDGPDCCKKAMRKCAEQERVEVIRVRADGSVGGTRSKARAGGHDRAAGARRAPRVPGTTSFVQFTPRHAREWHTGVTTERIPTNHIPCELVKHYAQDHMNMPGMCGKKLGGHFCSFATPSADPAPCPDCRKADGVVPAGDTQGRGEVDSMHDVRQHLAGYHCHSAGGGHLRCVACGTLHSTTSTYDAHTSTKMHKEEVTQMPVWLRRNCGLPVAEGEVDEEDRGLAYHLWIQRRNSRQAAAAPIVPNPVSRALFPPGIVDTTDIFDAGTPGMASKARPGPKAGRKPVARHEPEVMEFTEDEDEDGEEGEVGRGEHSPDRDVSFRGCHPAPDGLRILEVIEFSEDEDAEERAFIGDLAIKDREEANNGHEWPGDYPLAFQNKMELTFDMAVALEAAQLADNCGPSGLYSPAPSTGSSTLYDPPSAPAPMGDTGDADPPSLTPSRALSLALAGSTAVGGPSRPALPRPTNSSSILRYSRLADTDEPPAPRATSAKGKGRAEPLSDAEPNEQATGYDAPPFNERDVPPQEPGHNPRPGPVPGEPAFGQADAEPVLPHGDAGSEEDWMEYLFFD